METTPFNSATNFQSHRLDEPQNNHFSFQNIDMITWKFSTYDHGLEHRTMDWYLVYLYGKGRDHTEDLGV